MSKLGLVGISAVVLVTVGASFAHATDISAKKVSIKDNANAAKRQIQVQSGDAAVTLAAADNPGNNGAAIHVYSATDDFCAILAAGPEWKLKVGKSWKYTNKLTKNSAQVADGKLSVKIKSGVTYTLADNGTQGTVNVQVQFGTGTRYCMKCTGNKKDDVKSFSAKACVAAACDAEPSTCDSVPTTTTTVTTTTSTSTSTTTTTCVPPASLTVLKGALPPTAGRFNYNMTLGLPGANSFCNTNFAGTHACTVSELQSAQTAGDLVCLHDINNNAVTGFWAIDGTQPALEQCNDDNAGGSGLNWEYGTAHTMSRGEKIALTNGSGTLGPVVMHFQCNLSAASWVGCCQ